MRGAFSGGKGLLGGQRHDVRTSGVKGLRFIGFVVGSPYLAV